MGRVRQCVDDSLKFGTEHIWVIDPDLRKTCICTKTGFHEPESGILSIPDTPIQVVLLGLFAELDRA
jgi:hypothetical protein